MEPTSPHHPDNWNRINVPPRVAERAATNVATATRRLGGQNRANVTW